MHRYVDRARFYSSMAYVPMKSNLFHHVLVRSTVFTERTFRTHPPPRCIFLWDLSKKHDPRGGAQSLSIGIFPAHWYICLAILRMMPNVAAQLRSAPVFYWRNVFRCQPKKSTTGTERVVDDRGGVPTMKTDAVVSHRVMPSSTISWFFNILHVNK